MKIALRTAGRIYPKHKKAEEKRGSLLFCDEGRRLVLPIKLFLYTNAACQKQYANLLFSILFSPANRCTHMFQKKELSTQSQVAAAPSCVLRPAAVKYRKPVPAKSIKRVN